MSPKSARVLLLSIGCVMLGLMIGCGDGKIDTESVVGVVTLDGAPLADAMVNFTPAVEGKGTPSYAKTDAAGKYQLQTLLGNADAGTTPGDYIVTVSKIELKETGKTIENSDGTKSPEKESEELLPKKYTDAKTSDLKATVAPGGNTLNFDLKSK